MVCLPKSRIIPAICKQCASLELSRILSTPNRHVSHLARNDVPKHNAVEMLEIEQLIGFDQQSSTTESVCASVAKLFNVKPTEIALLELSGNLLKFIYPVELRKAGAIPLSSSAVAARTARTKRSELFNSFVRVKHSSVFEVVKLRETSAGSEVIQKLMSVPVLSKAAEVIGVIQVSRKAERASSAGDDFTSDELRKLESVAVVVARLMTKEES